MPRVKSVKSLKAICMNFILENQEIYSERFPIIRRNRGRNALNSDEPVVNPFDDLPTEIVEELIKFYGEKETNRYAGEKSSFAKRAYKITKFVNLLLTPRLRTLDLTRIKLEGLSYALKLTTNNKNPQLKTSYLKSFISIPKFTKLRILNIYLTRRGDECFELIGKHCPDLREFSCSSYELTDDGIRKFCVDGNCKLIHKLNLERCSQITTKGIQLALDNLPHLRILRHKSLLECLAEIAQAALDQNVSLPKYSLTALSIRYDTVYKSGSLQKSVLLCPNVTEVYLNRIQKARFNDTELLGLLSLEKLETIEITYAEFEQHSSTPETRINRGLTFDGVVPLIRKFGYHLKRLHLGGFYFIDIPIIIEFCINLESLNISKCKMCPSTETTVTKMPVLHNLKRLCLHYLTFENLFPLLSSPSLSYIEVIGCKALTDKVLQRAASLHSFRNLEYLNLEKCKSITKMGINIFLKESNNPLRKIILSFNNTGISRKDYIDWNKNAIWIKKNWQFEFILKRRTGNMYIGEHDIKDFDPDLTDIYHMQMSAI